MTDPDPIIRPFAEWLREQGGGRTHNELGEGLHDLLARCSDTGKKGSITLTVTVEPAKDVPGMVIVKDQIKLILPEFDRPAGMYWLDGHGNLSRSDPNQPELDGLREVPPIPYDPATGEVIDDRKAN